MGTNLLKGKSLSQKQAAGVMLEGVASGDEVLQFDPESRWIYPPEKDLFAPLLPSDWRHNRNIEIQGQLFSMNRRGDYILRPFESKSAFFGMAQNSMRDFELLDIHKVQPATQKLQEVAHAAARHLMESGEIPYDISNKLASYVPYVSGPYDRQQYISQLLLAKSRAYYSWNSNPFGHRIPLILAHFVIGRGVAAMFKDEMAQQIWDRFSEYNGFAMRYQGSGRPKLTGNKLTTYNVMLSVDGELMFHFTPAQDTLRVQALDSATVLEVVTNPWDIEEVYYYHQQFMPQWQLYANPDVPTATFTIRQIPADQVLHVTINTFDNEKRGRADCMSVYGWMRRAADIANSSATSAYMRSCQVWDIAVEGSPTEVSTIANNIRTAPHRPGMAYVHSSNVTRQLIGPTYSGSGVDNDLAGLINLIAIGSGIPPAYLLGSMGANRAGVLAETEPSGKAFLDRQELNERILHEMKYRLFKYQRDVLGVRVKSDECEFIFPSINMYDRMNFLSALGIMEDRQWFKSERCATLAAKEFQTTNYNYEDEFAEIQETATLKSRYENERNIENQQAMVAAQGGPAYGQENTDQTSSAGDSKGTEGKSKPGLRFLGASKSSSKGPNGSGGLDEREAAQTRKSLSTA